MHKGGIILKTPEQIERIAKAGALTARLFDELDTLERTAALASACVHADDATLAVYYPDLATAPAPVTFFPYVLGQYAAGNYDGVVGTVGGLAAVRRLIARGPLTHPLEFILFMSEESSRFGFATMGSKAMAGSANLAAWAAGWSPPGAPEPDADLREFDRALAAWWPGRPAAVPPRPLAARLRGARALFHRQLAAGLAQATLTLAALAALLAGRLP